MKKMRCSRAKVSSNKLATKAAKVLSGKAGKETKSLAGSVLSQARCKGKRGKL
jgi:hypothetical protein